MNFLFILNPNKLHALDCATRAIHILKSRGCEVYALPEYVELFHNLAVKEFKMSDEPSLIDMVVTIGGDGTLIHSAEKALTLDKPIVGINSGRLGFLTELEQNELDNLQQLVDGKFEIQERMVLAVDHYHRSGCRRNYDRDDCSYAAHVDFLRYYVCAAPYCRLCCQPALQKIHHKRAAESCCRA